MTDSELVERVKRKMELDQSFEVLLGRHEELVRSVIGRAVRDPDDAEEIFERTIVVAYQDIGSYNPAAGGFGAWLCGIAQHQVEHLRRSRQRERPALCRWRVRCEADTVDPAEQYEERRDALQLREYLRGLPTLHRYVVRKHRCDEVPYEELAQELHTTVRHVKYLYSQGLAMLRQMYGVTRPGHSPVTAAA